MAGVPGINFDTPSSCVVADIRGIVTSIPIPTINSKLNSLWNHGLMGAVKSSKRPPTFKIATTANNGKTIPVIVKPVKPRIQLSPDRFPIVGGKIKLPAPK